MNCKIDDVNIYYEDIGQGKPIIMIHGYSTDHRLMTECMEPIMQEHREYRRIYIDLPGMGQSGYADWIDSTDDILNIVLKFIDTIIPNSHFLLAGESYGGYISRGIIYKRKELIDGVLFICPVIIAESQQRNRPPHSALIQDQKFLSSLPSDEVKKFQKCFVVQNAETYRRYKAEIQSGIYLAHHEFLHKIKQKYSFSFNVDQKKYAEFYEPTLFLLGHQDSCVGYQDAWNVIENYPRATFAILDIAGHNLQIEQVKLFQYLVNDWITRTEQN